MSFPDPLAKYNCKLWTLYGNQTKMTLEDGEKSDWLQTSGSEEQHSGDISEFSFLVLSFSFFFSFASYGHTPDIWKFPG